ncbi:hypothetical protein ASE00_17460 [Sphingomonas sp. Root710]|uniref:YdcH family protein n=1 Tax=Sphingomonas sp. Root710 TaxID=1736594 RepID=UPI0006FC9947|nr:YdcH family protein [Sphingomonas sp. Root710]KRB80806.1 hypothetical protein ASE00_17460 [Sphingomonas sp. Root710]
MSNRFFTYLEREHSRLEALIAAESRRPRPDDLEITRLKKQKLMVRDQLDRWRQDARETAGA